MRVRLIVSAVVAQVALASSGCDGGGHGGSLNGDGGGGVDGAERPAPPMPYPRPEYQTLSETGLFSDPIAHTVAHDVSAFEPTYRLWSDGADKRRWVRLPPGTQIDSSDMDHWILPLGTKLWKEFSRNGVLLETRLIERYGEGPEDYWMGAFVWTDDQSDAAFAIDGQRDIAGTMHDVPAQKDCGACHRGEVGRVLGYSAIQLSAAPTGPTLSMLNTQGLLSHPPEGDASDHAAPGDPDTAEALGYLHANCGHCHNKNGTAWPDTQMVTRLRIAERDANASETYRSLVGKALQYWRGGAITLRVAPGDPNGSAIVARMQLRGSDDQMPPIATEIIDTAGLDSVRRWIATLTP